MAVRSELEFKPTERPAWRDDSVINTSKMIDEIVQFRKDYCDLEEEGKKFCENNFAPYMAVDFICNINIGEQVGSQTKAETEDILKNSLPKDVNGASSQDKKKTETLNTHLAMTRLHQIFEEMESRGFLTVDLLCEVHSVLMKDLHLDAGKMRTNEAYTDWNGVHFYPPPDQISARLYGLIDCHNIYVDRLPPRQSREEVEYIIKVAARIMFDFVNTHPFGDGNGRMCRLLANYTLHLITPFPVGIYHTNCDEGIGRKDYVNAIVQCRDSPEEGPCDIAAMLVEGVWKGWKNFFRNLKSRKFKRQLVIQMGKPNELSEKVDRLIKNTKSIALNKETVMKCIRTTLENLDTTNLEHHQYRSLCVKLEPNLDLELKVFN